VPFFALTGLKKQLTAIWLGAKTGVHILKTSLIARQNRMDSLTKASLQRPYGAYPALAHPARSLGCLQPDLPRDLRLHSARFAVLAFLLKICVLRFGLLQDGDAGVGCFCRE
jgi:hypothetical protein